MSIYGDLIKEARSEEPVAKPKEKRKSSKKSQKPELTIVPKPEQEQHAQLKVSIEQIQIHPDQPRKYFDPERMDELIASIDKDGILEPLIVRSLEHGKYELVAGERRLRASKELGLHQVPVIIHTLTENQARRIALVENLQREDLNPIEEIEAVLKLIALELGITEDNKENPSDKKENPSDKVAKLLYKMQNEAKGKVTHKVMGSSQGETIEEVFQGLGISWKSFVSNKLPVRKWEIDVREKVKKGEIAFEAARLIARVTDDKERATLLSEAESLSIPEVKARIEQAKATSSAKSGKSTKTSIKSEVDLAYKQLRKSKVWDDPKKEKSIKNLLTQINALLKEA